jgi:hypothetical protein
MGVCSVLCQSTAQNDILLKIENKNYEKLKTSFKSENDSVNQGLCNCNNSSIFNSNKYLKVINSKKQISSRKIKGEQIFQDTKKKYNSNNNLIVINKKKKKKNESKSVKNIDEEILQNHNDFSISLISSINVDIINENDKENKREEDKNIDSFSNKLSIQSNNNNIKKNINHPIYAKLIQHSKSKQKLN